MKLHTKIGLGLLLGALAGSLANLFVGDAAWALWLTDNVATPVGQIFLRLLLMTVVPLVFSSLTVAAGGFGDLGKLGRVGGRTLALFVISTAMSAGIGLTLVNVLQPGAGIDDTVRQELFDTYSTRARDLAAPAQSPFGIQTFVRIVPNNPVQAAASMDMLGVIFFSLLFGAALTMIRKDQADPVLAFLRGVNEALLMIIGLAMRLAPYGVFALIFAVTARFGWHLLRELSLYVGVVLLGLLVHAAVGISGIVALLGGMPPHRFWWKIRGVVVTAFSTSSSNATLPTSIATAEQQLGIPAHVASFVLPLGATMNMNGTALYEGVTVLFIAQVFGIELSLGQQLVVLVLAVLTAVGAAGVPGGSLPLLMVVLGTVGVPPEGIAIVLGVDRLLDMSRTSLNVCGDLGVAVAVARAERVWGLPPVRTEGSTVE
jgi:DAACS family dicarboxylate/amino acid:cation (Na+ or H+) symporter